MWSLKKWEGRSQEYQWERKYGLKKSWNLGQDRKTRKKAALSASGKKGNYRPRDKATRDEVVQKKKQLHRSWKLGKKRQSKKKT